MATSGTTNYKLKVDELIEEAYEHAKGFGIILNSQNAKSARRSLNILLRSIVNDGYPMSQKKLVEIPMVEGTREYDLDNSFYDIVSLVSVTNTGGQELDLNMSKISEDDYLFISNKTIKGRPTQYAVALQRDDVKLYVYPTPDANTPKLKGYALKQIEDVTALTEDVDISTNYYGAIVAGLAYQLAKKSPEVFDTDKDRLRADFAAELQTAKLNDRERSDLTFSLGGGR